MSIQPVQSTDFLTSQQMVGGLMRQQGNTTSPSAGAMSNTAGLASGDGAAMRGRADAVQFSSKMRSPGDETNFSMSTYTQNGTLVQVEAGQRSFTMGNLQPSGQNNATNSFQLAGARDDLNMQVLFTAADGKTTAFALTETSTFHETEDGKIVEGRGKRNAVKDPNDPENLRDEANIVINLDDKGAVLGGDGDDLLINFGAEARVNGNEGDDNLINMADQVTLDGGAGDDLIKVIDDVIREPQKGTIDFTEVGYSGGTTFGIDSSDVADLLPETLVGLNKGTEVTIQGGDGNDTIDARNAKLERASVQGGDGDDLMMLDVLAASTVDGGDGNDTIDVQNALQSTIDGGDGDDAVSLDRGKSVTLKGGDGEDTISANFMAGGAILGGDGNDTIAVSKAANTTIDAGGGDDLVTIDNMIGGTLLGGAGDDTLLVKRAMQGTILGGAGNDIIGVGSAVGVEIQGGVDDDTAGVVTGSSTISDNIGNNTVLSGNDAGVLFGGGTVDKLV